MIVNTATSPASTLKDAMAKCTKVPFDTSAKLVLKATKGFDKASEDFRDSMEVALNQYVDLCFQANGRTEASCKTLQKSIMECELVQNSVALGTMKQKTWTEYALGAARALYWNVKWTPTLKNEPDMGLPWGKAKGGSTGTTSAGPVKSTSREALDQTLTKALQQARLLGLTEFAATLLDHCIDSLENFKEVESK
jgi:hypothetical protein